MRYSSSLPMAFSPFGIINSFCQKGEIYLLKYDMKEQENNIPSQISPTRRRFLWTMIGKYVSFIILS